MHQSYILAAIARQVYLHKGLGVGTLRRFYGGALNRGQRPSKHSKASGAVLRKALQALEKVKVIEQDQYGGRKVTQIGQQELDRIAHQVATQ
jgi:small subunit ribosomal protein S19e